jgi:hypothetical protein
VNTADSVWAFELASRAEEIAARLGLEKVRFAPGPLAVQEEPASRVPGPEPSPAELAAAAGIAARITDEKLRRSVERAASLSLAKGA